MKFKKGLEEANANCQETRAILCWRFGLRATAIPVKIMPDRRVSLRQHMKGSRSAMKIVEEIGPANGRLPIGSKAWKGADSFHWTWLYSGGFSCSCCVECAEYLVQWTGCESVRCSKAKVGPWRPRSLIFWLTFITYTLMYLLAFFLNFGLDHLSLQPWMEHHVGHTTSDSLCAYWMDEVKSRALRILRGGIGTRLRGIPFESRRTTTCRHRVSCERTFAGACFMLVFR